MAGVFPTLKRGNTVFYPLRDTQSFSTGLAKFLDDSEQRWRKRRMLRRFVLTCTDINAYDVSLILNFFRSQAGRFDSTWSLSIGGNTYHNLAFDTDTFQMIENKTNRMALSFNVVQVVTDNPAIPAISAYFPQITGGVMTTLPYSSALSYRSTAEDSDFTGRRSAWKWRANPLGSYAINLQALTAAELAIVQNFFYSMEGRKGEFAFLDPGGNLVNYSDDFTNASWTKSSINVSVAATDPLDGNLATLLGSTGSNGLLYTTVIPAGLASGFVLTVSVWAKAIGAGQSLAIGFMDNTLTNLGNVIWPLPQGVWQRISCTITLATNNPIIVNIGGANTWSTGQLIQLFSAGCVPMPGAGPRLLTPGMDGLRPHCRFDTDDFIVDYQDFGKTAVNLPVMEFTYA